MSRSGLSRSIRIPSRQGIDVRQQIAGFIQMLDMPKAGGFAQSIAQDHTAHRTFIQACCCLDLSGQRIDPRRRRVVGRRVGSHTLGHEATSIAAVVRIDGKANAMARKEQATRITAAIAALTTIAVAGKLTRSWTAWLGREDSNLRMGESKSPALPLGYAPTATSAPGNLHRTCSLRIACRKSGGTIAAPIPRCNASIEYFPGQGKPPSGNREQAG